MSSPPEMDPELKARLKEAARENRLSFRNRAEQLLRYEMKEEAKEICKPHVNAFAECAQENGLWVVWSCQDKLKQLNACMAKHNGEEAWQKYKEAHQKELEVRAQGKKYV